MKTNPDSPGRVGAVASGEDASDGVRLFEIRPGHCGTICEVQAGDDETDRLMAMGVCLGRRIMLIQHGDPMILKVLGSRIGVSARLAARVMVVPCENDLCSPD